jgi:NDP-sugar pyrophosphorylase family protein
MIGVILAAGMAKRLRPLTDTKPKCLLKVGVRTLLERTVDAMRQAGIQEFLVVTGYRGEMIRDFLGEYSSRSSLSSLPSQPSQPSASAD